MYHSTVLVLVLAGCVSARFTTVTGIVYVFAVCQRVLVKVRQYRRARRTVYGQKIENRARDCERRRRDARGSGIANRLVGVNIGEAATGSLDELPSWKTPSGIWADVRIPNVAPRLQEKRNKIHFSCFTRQRS